MRRQYPGSASWQDLLSSGTWICLQHLPTYPGTWRIKKMAIYATAPSAADILSADGNDIKLPDDLLLSPH